MSDVQRTEFDQIESDLDDAKMDYSAKETAYKIANADEVANQEAAAREIVLEKRLVDENAREDAVGVLMDEKRELE
jgi:hypothetical protein